MSFSDAGSKGAAYLNVEHIITGSANEIANCRLVFSLLNMEPWREAKLVACHLVCQNHDANHLS